MRPSVRTSLRTALLLFAMGTAGASEPAKRVGILTARQGHWLGDMKTPEGRTLKFGAEIFVRADGSCWASASSPDQGAYDIPVRSIQESGDTLELDITVGTLKLTWAKDHFDGEFRQGPVSMPLKLRSVAAFPKKVRPQTPKEPFPYRNETLAITSADGVKLGATLSIPDGVAHPNAVVLVPGSGPATRDTYNDGHELFAVLADQLARRGVAVLRYDKRGISRSTGDYEHHTLPQLVDDLDSAFRVLKARKSFARIGLIGHSEGSQIAAAVAARNPKSMDFVVSLAGTGLPGLECMLLQDRVWAKDHGATPDGVERLMAYVRKYYETILAQAEVKPRVEALKALHNGLSPEDKALVVKHKMDQGTLSLEWAEKPFLRVMLMSNPQVDWRAVRCPVLALNGSLDHQVPAEGNLGGIVSALKAGGNLKVESAVLPSLNHPFQTAKTGAEGEYALIDETMAPMALERIAAFVTRQR